jgi:methylated-DNA-[protein]-cysteine S-methyltransferase
MNASREPHWYCVHATPIGPLVLAARAAGLTHVLFAQGSRAAPPGPEWELAPPRLARAAAQLDEYFAGHRRTFELTLAPSGTPFQLCVWHALAGIPYGETVSYGDLARQLGLRNGSRAVGLANGANPLPIVVPCHRVIGSDGSLTGFGGGLDLKRRLLELEGAACVRSAQATLF